VTCNKCWLFEFSVKTWSKSSELHTFTKLLKIPCESSTLVLEQSQWLQDGWQPYCNVSTLLIFTNRLIHRPLLSNVILSLSAWHTIHKRNLTSWFCTVWHWPYARCELVYTSASANCARSVAGSTLTRSSGCDAVRHVACRVAGRK